MKNLDENIIRTLFPNLELLTDEELWSAIGGIAGLGASAEQAERVLLCDFYSRVLLALEVERVRRGYESVTALSYAVARSISEKQGIPLRESN